MGTSRCSRRWGNAGDNRSGWGWCCRSNWERYPEEPYRRWRKPAGYCHLARKCANQASRGDCQCAARVGSASAESPGVFPEIDTRVIQASPFNGSHLSGSSAVPASAVISTVDCELMVKLSAVIGVLPLTYAMGPAQLDIVAVPAMGRLMWLRALLDAFCTAAPHVANDVYSEASVPLVILRTCKVICTVQPGGA